MPRQPKPWPRRNPDGTLRGYYVTINGKQHNLGKKQQEAFRKYHRLIAKYEELGDNPEVRKIVFCFLEWSEANHADGTHRFYKLYCESFLKSLRSELRIADLKPDHVTRWADRRHPPKDSNNNTRLNAMRAVVRPFGYAVKQRIIGVNPVAGMEKPRSTRRDTYIDAKEYQEILGAIRKGDGAGFRDFIEVLRHTGCRPEEARKLTAKEFDRGNHRWELRAEFTAKVKEARSIPLDDRAYELCCKWADKNPSGPIFRNRNGDPWKKKSLVDRCRRLRERLGFYFTPYTLRHSFITDALEQGVDPITVARIVGHRNLDMINRVYSHIEQRSEHMQKSANRATRHLQSGLG